MYAQGEIIAAKLPSGIEHYGLATGHGTVISASKRTGLVLEECLEAFCGGHPVIRKGYPSDLNPTEVISKARAGLGKTWNLLFDNCQHFATECHGDRRSPQLRALLMMALLIVAYRFCLTSK